MLELPVLRLMFTLKVVLGAMVCVAGERERVAAPGVGVGVGVTLGVGVGVVTVWVIKVWLVDVARLPEASRDLTLYV